MGLYTTLPTDLDEVDVIIAGGGTAGCIVASRIASALPSLSVLLIEGGSNNAGNPTVSVPLLFFSHLAPDAPTNITYTSSAEPQLAGRQLAIPAGGVLGGGSSINMMAYSRALRRDWDAWDTEGWRGDDMLSYLTKTETYSGPGDSSIHGSSGPLQVSPGTFASARATSQFVAAAESLGFPEVEDINDLVSANGVQRALRYISPSGVRQDVASRYVHPRLEDGEHRNLHVLLEHRVVRVLFEGTRASGVEFVANPRFQPTASSSTRSVKARKMVVVSCGSFGTPSVLERSGVGSKDVLRRAGVEVASDLPSAGEGYQDHSLMIYGYHTALDASETVNAAIAKPETFGKWMQEGKDILGWNAQEVTYKLRPDDNDIARLGDGFKRFWQSKFQNERKRPLTQGSLVLCCPDEPSPSKGRENICTSNFVLYPESRGHIHITGPSITDAIDFKSGILSDADNIDATAHIWAYKTQREMMRRMPVYRGEVAATHPAFPAGSAAACVDLDAQVETPVEKIAYTAEDDKAIEEWVRGHVTTAWHPLGTCKMAPRESGGVVDKDLSVYGVQGLKVADLSIAPQNVAANTVNTALAVGERAADIFILELTAV